MTDAKYYKFDPIQIELGHGRVQITSFTDSDGFGLIFYDTGVDHEIGLVEPVKEELLTPKTNEISIKCTNAASAKVLLDMVTSVYQSLLAVEKFNE